MNENTTQTLTKVASVLQEAGLTGLEVTAVATALLVEGVRNCSFPSHVKRGKVINSVSGDIRRALQQHLPKELTYHD